MSAQVSAARIFLAVLFVLLLLLFPIAASAQIGVQLYNGSWVAEAFGNDLATNGVATDGSALFSVFGMPQGQLCNPGNPRCSFQKTPVSAIGGKFFAIGTLCTPLAAFGTPTRPAKGATKTAAGKPTSKAVRYRNPFFFTTLGAPKLTSCSATTTVAAGPATVPLTTNSPLRGAVMKGAPLTGSGTANVTASLGFSFGSAPATPTGGASGFRRTTVGEFNNIPPYLYSYTYATLRNGAGVFGPNLGPGDFTVAKKIGGTFPAKAVVKKGPNQFGGVMTLLGQLTTKVCYFRNGGCSLGEQNWRYEEIGHSAVYSGGGMVTKGFFALYSAMYYHTKLMQGSTVMVEGSRFPWTTGTVTVTATGRGPHNTIQQRKGNDNRATTGASIGQGTIQLVTPVITRWNQPSANFETGGIGVLRLQFVPEPSQWVVLVAGLSGLGVLFRARR